MIYISVSDFCIPWEAIVSIALTMYLLDSNKVVGFSLPIWLYSIEVEGLPEQDCSGFLD